ncbi:MAG: putative inorganic carbon transporter subunit DabA [Bryobacteraceae bacterium]
MARLLPVQGPIGVFIHHNTLHAFEHLPFEEAVVEASHLFGAEPYMTEEAYRDQMRKGRIEARDLDAVLANEPDTEVLPQHGLTQRSLQRAILASGLRPFEANTIDWLLNEGDLLSRLRPDLDPVTRSKVLEPSGDRESVGAGLLFSACLSRVKVQPQDKDSGAERLRDALFNSAGVDLDDVIHPYLIRLTEVFLDQGLAYWPMPDRALGFYAAVRTLLVQPLFIHPRRLTGLRKELARQADEQLDAAGVVLDFLHSFRIPEQNWEQYLRSELLALPGWAGLMHRLEKEPNLLPHESLTCSLLDFLAVRLTLTTVAVHNIALEAGLAPEFAGDWQAAKAPLVSRSQERLRLAARMFDAAQLLGLNAGAIDSLTESQFDRLQQEVDRLDDLECRRLLHQAYERAHERLVLQPLGRHRLAHPPQPRTSRPKAQVFFCLDEREESFRRHLEELDPGVETFAAAGFMELPWTIRASTILMVFRCVRWW